MKESLLSLAAATLVTAAICFLTPLAANAQGRQPRSGKSNEKYLVVQIIDPSKDVPNDTARNPNANATTTTYDQMYKVITTSQLKDEKKRIEEEYKKLIEEWEDKKQIDPQTPKPKKATIKTLKTFQTQSVADEYRKKLLDDLAKKDGDKPGAADAGGKPGPAK